MFDWVFNKFFRNTGLIWVNNCKGHEWDYNIRGSDYTEFTATNNRAMRISCKHCPKRRYFSENYEVENYQLLSDVISEIPPEVKEAIENAKKVEFLTYSQARELGLEHLK